MDHGVVFRIWNYLPKFPIQSRIHKSFLRRVPFPQYLRACLSLQREIPVLWVSFPNVANDHPLHHWGTFDTSNYGDNLARMKPNQGYMSTARQCFYPKKLKYIWLLSTQIGEEPYLVSTGSPRILCSNACHQRERIRAARTHITIGYDMLQTHRYSSVRIRRFLRTSAGQSHITGTIVYLLCMQFSFFFLFFFWSGFCLENSGIWFLWNMGNVEFSRERVAKTYTIAFQCATVKNEK